MPACAPLYTGPGLQASDGPGPRHQDQSSTLGEAILASIRVTEREGRLSRASETLAELPLLLCSAEVSRDDRAHVTCSSLVAWRAHLLGCEARSRGPPPPPFFFFL